jgi:hypothetical protein
VAAVVAAADGPAAIAPLAASSAAVSARERAKANIAQTVIE